jgi:hypothetical protein
MLRRFNKKRPLALSALLLLLLAGGAVAYFTTTGSGTGSATVGTNSALTIHGSSASTLYPGTSSTISFTIDNSSPGHQQLGTIHLASVKACIGAGSSWNGSSCSSGGSEAATCESVETGASDTNSANFWMPDVVSGQDFGNGNGQSVAATGSLKMNDLASNQDSCENANLTLNFTS